MPLLACFVGAPALPAMPAPPGLSAPEAGPVPFEEAIAGLSSRDAAERLKAAALLTAAPYPDAAIPLAKAVGDPDDAVQFQAIAAELNIFLANKIVPKKHVGLVVEVRGKIAAEPIFSAGPLILDATPVPLEVLAALRAAARDQNPRVGVEALYAFGALASEPTGARRRELRQVSAPELAALAGASDETLRAAAVRVAARVYEASMSDDAADTSVGDAIIGVLNDPNRLIKRAAMDTLGAMRYERGVEALTQLFQYYKQGDLAEAAFDALARIAHPGSSALFSSQLQAKTANIRAMAIEGLARTADASKMAEIESALQGEKSDRVIFAGTFAAAMLTGGSVERIADSLRRPRLRDVSKQYLADITRGRAALLGRYTKDPDPAMRADIADVLGFSNDSAAQPLVESMIGDQDTQVALAAGRAALRLRGADDLPHGER